ncbi:hypothetical protein GJ496_003697 [Pomphorhynchus laevis]|nr:hypothetical protein GJ496_003697 [Pomphorhynchus laevis]
MYASKLFESDNILVFDCLGIPRVFTELQIYSYADDDISHSNLYQGIEHMVDNKIWRKFYHESMGTYFMETDSYTNWCLKCLANRRENINQKCKEDVILKLFFDNFISTLPSDQTVVNRVEIEKRLELNESLLNRLIQQGILSIEGGNSWRLSVPRIGFLLVELREGRNTLKCALNRRKSKQILISDLYRLMTETNSSNALKKWRLGFNYHLSDALGSQIVRKYDTSMGPMISKHIEK